jgi:transcriptional regulator with XRE-family HTH domain
MMRTDAHEIKLGQILRQLIEGHGYNRNRQKILRAVGISATALSQYLHDQVRPSFRTLVALAEFFDVSLDYLVFGIKQEPPGAVPDYGPLARYIDLSLSGIQAKAAQHMSTMGRISSALAREIDQVARRVGEEAALPAGMLLDDESLVLEGYSVDTTIVSLNLQHDIVAFEGTKAAGRFLPVVAHNLIAGRSYRFLLPAPARDRRPVVDSFREILQASGVASDTLVQNCRFRVTSVPIATGLGLCQFDIALLRREQPLLYEQISEFIDVDGGLGYVIAANDDVKADTLMDALHLGQARQSVEYMWKAAKPV